MVVCDVWVLAGCQGGNLLAYRVDVILPDESRGGGVRQSSLTSICMGGVSHVLKVDELDGYLQPAASEASMHVAVGATADALQLLYRCKVHTAIC